MKKCLVAFLILSIFSVLPAAFAQSATGNLTGNVRDDKGEPLPGASITAKNTDTGFERTDVSAEGGLYRISSLPFGTYDVTASVQGFATQVQTDVRVDVGRTVPLDFSMKLSTTSEVMTIVSEAPLIERTESHVATVVTPEQAQNLPLNGRQFANLAALAPGTTLKFHPDPTKSSTVLSVSTIGGSGRNINISVDGGDNNDDTVGGIIQFYSLESVAEFNFLTNRYKAEYGRSAGGVLNLVTKSGTNDFHGTFFSLFRNDSLNGLTRSEKDAGIEDPSPFSREQFGGSVGGPIIKDRAHFFFAMERFQEDREDVIDSGGIVPSLDGTTFALPQRDTLVTAKATMNINPDQFMTVRYGQQKTESIYGSGPTYAPSARASNENTFHSFLASHSWVISENRLNEFTFQWADFTNIIAALSNDPTELFPNGFNLGVNVNTPQSTLQEKFQFRDDYSFSWRSNHHMKAGVAFIHEPTLGGTFTTGIIPQYHHLGDSLTSPIDSIAQQGGEFNTDFANKQVGFYVQDDWNFNEKLTLNLGVRYDYVFGSKFPELDQSGNALCAVVRSLPYDFPWLQSFKDGPADCKTSPDGNNVAPRVGFAYDWKGDGRTVFRGGYGLYYDFPYANANLLFPQAVLGGYGTAYSHSNTDGIRNADGTFFQIGDPLPPNQAVGFPPAPNELLSPDFAVPYTHQASFGMSHQMSPDAAIDVDYVHASVRDQFIRFKVNGLVAPGQFLLPGFGTGGALSGTRIWYNGGFSDYDGVSFTYRGRVHKMVQLQTSYTLSRVNGDTMRGSDEFVVDDRTSQGGCRDCTVDFTIGPKDDPRMEGPLDTDARHRFVVGGIFDLPAEFRVAAFLRARSARPFNAFVVTDPNNDGFAYDLTDDHVNSRRGHSASQFDLRVAKMFHIKDMVRIEGILEVFNLFNSENPGGENPGGFNGNLGSDAFGDPLTFAGDAGQGEQRLAQVGFRVEF